MNKERGSEIENYSISIIKPDAFRDHLSQMIIADFEEAGLEIIHRKEFKLDRPRAEYVYNEHREDKDRYPFMIESLLLKDRNGEQLPCMLLVMRATNDEISALELSQRAKGRADHDGIRKKYAMFQVRELKDMGYEGDGLSTMLSRNRLHIPDDYDRVMEIIGVLLTNEDVDQIEEVDPEFAKILKISFDKVTTDIVPLSDGESDVK